MRSLLAYSSLHRQVGWVALQTGHVVLWIKFMKVGSAPLYVLDKALWFCPSTLVLSIPGGGGRSPTVAGDGQSCSRSRKQEWLANDIRHSATRWPDWPSALEPKKSETNRFLASWSASGCVNPLTSICPISSSDRATMLPPLSATGRKWSNPDHGAGSRKGWRRLQSWKHR